MKGRECGLAKCVTARGGFVLDRFGAVENPRQAEQTKAAEVTVRREGAFGMIERIDAGLIVGVLLTELLAARSRVPTCYARRVAVESKSHVGDVEVEYMHRIRFPVSVQRTQLLYLSRMLSFSNSLANPRLQLSNLAKLPQSVPKTPVP